MTKQFFSSHGYHVSLQGTMDEVTRKSNRLFNFGALAEPPVIHACDNGFANATGKTTRKRFLRALFDIALTQPHGRDNSRGRRAGARGVVARAAVRAAHMLREYTQN